MEQFNSPFFTIKCISPIKWVPMLTHTLPVLYNFFKGKKPTQSIAFEVTLPEEFYTEVIYCLAQLKGFFFFKWAHDLVSFQDYPLWDNTSQNIYKGKA